MGLALPSFKPPWTKKTSATGGDKTPPLCTATAERPIAIARLEDIELFLRVSLIPFREIAALSFKYYPPKNPTQLEVELRKVGDESTIPWATIYFGRHTRAERNAINFQGVDKSLLTDPKLESALEKALDIRKEFPTLCETASSGPENDPIFYVSARELGHIFKRYPNAWVLISSPVVDECTQGIVQGLKTCARSLTIDFDPKQSFYRSCVDLTDTKGAPEVTLGGLDDTFVVRPNSEPLAIKGSPKILTPMLHIQFLDPAKLNRRR